MSEMTKVGVRVAIESIVDKHLENIAEWEGDDDATFDGLQEMLTAMMDELTDYFDNLDKEN